MFITVWIKMWTVGCEANTHLLVRSSPQITSVWVNCSLAYTNRWSILPFACITQEKVWTVIRKHWFHQSERPVVLVWAIRKDWIKLSLALFHIPWFQTAAVFYWIGASMCKNHFNDVGGANYDYFIYCWVGEPIITGYIIISLLSEGNRGVESWGNIPFHFLPLSPDINSFG